MQLGFIDFRTPNSDYFIVNGSGYIMPVITTPLIIFRSTNESNESISSSNLINGLCFDPKKKNIQAELKMEIDKHFQSNPWMGIVVI